MYARVIVDVAPDHLDHPFDYRVPDGVDVVVGQQVRVAFSGRRRDAWVVGLSETSAASQARVQPLLTVHPTVLFGEAELRLWRWVADRYAAPMASVIRHALPKRMAGIEREALRWAAPPARTAAQRPPCPDTAWRAYQASALLNAVAKGGSGAWWLRPLPGDEPADLVADLVARCVASGRDALVLSPDPASAVPAAALAQAVGQAADLRATDDLPGRYRAFMRARSGHARVAVGERGAVFTPLAALGLIVVEDEANPAWKERRNPRHHVREVALGRARMAGAVCVLTSDLPSALLWRHLQDGHVSEIAVDREEERRRAPRIEVVDRADPNPTARRTRFSNPAVKALSAAVRDGGAAVVLAVRGGEGTALACKKCRRRRQCPNCGGSLKPTPASATAPQPQTNPLNPGCVDYLTHSDSYSTHPGFWGCVSCGWSGEPFACDGCDGQDTAPLAAGAGRLAAELAKAYPEAEVVRMEGFDAAGPTRLPGIAVMTRGSVVRHPHWLAGRKAHTVVLPDVDALLNRPSMDATEDTLRLWFAVARWTDHVVLQTDEPNHPAVQALVRWDASGFWRREVERREPLNFPPLRSLVKIHAPLAYAQFAAAALRDVLPAQDEVLGPGLDGELLVKSADLRGTLAAFTPLRHQWAKDDRGIKIDVDPVTLD